MKKNRFLKIAGLVLLLILGLLVALPFFLEGRIGSLLKTNVNNNINGTFDFEEAHLSLIRSFPRAELRVKDLYILNKAPFEGDTLLKAGELSVTMGLGELLKGAGEPIRIRSLDIDRAKLNILIDDEEHANYDIAKKGGGSDTTEPDSGDLSLDLQAYTLSNSEISYTDRSGGIHLQVSDIQHSGTGDLSLEQSELQTSTTALVTLDLDSTNYLNKNRVQLDALLGIDLSNNKYSFLKNEVQLNQLPLVFDGYVQLFDDYEDINLQFRTPSSDFRNFLAVIPETYTKEIEGVTTTGNFEVNGTIEGKLDETHIPKFTIKMASDNASFKYPDLPKSVRNIQINALVKNSSGLAEDTFVEIDKAAFMIDSDQFNLTARIRELMGNPKVEAHLVGDVDLANLRQAYPMPSNLNLKGRLRADITTAFDMASVEKKQYENTRTNGYFNLSNFEYASPELAHPLAIRNMAVTFNPQTVTLKEMTGTTGSTDFRADGSIHNLLGFMFNKELVEGNFNLASDTFALNDFMVKEEEAKTSGDQKEVPTSGTEKVKIPSFLDCTIQATAQTVLYDNLSLKNVSGTLRIKDQTATLSNLTSSIFDGKLALNGTVSTKEERPTFSMKLGMDGFRIGETFKSLEMFQVLAPVANALEGRLNSQIDISGLLTDDFTPDLASLSGNVLASLLGTEINPGSAPILNALSSKLDFINAGDFDLGNLKTALSFENGKVNVKPFTINYKDIAIKVEGGHSFDRTLNYSAVLQVPATYLGKDVNALLAKIDDSQLEHLSIPVTANIGGKYANPQISTDLTSGIKTLTAQLVEIQKQKLVNQGRAKAQDLIGGLLSGNTAGKDSTRAKDSTQTGVKQVIGGILSQKGQPRDTSVAGADSASRKEEPVKEAAKQILGNLLGKKKKEPAKKDSIQ